MSLSYSLLMPPMLLVVAVLLGAVLALRWRRLGLGLVLVSAILLYGFCTPFVSGGLLRLVENQVPVDAEEARGAQAIVVLGGDLYHGQPGGMADDVGLITLERLRHAAALYRQHPLPILVTGGPIGDSAESLAVLMRRVLQQDYGVPVSWLEERSRDTHENAEMSATILRAANIHTVLLVTQPWHMARALWSFNHAGLTAIPAPTARSFNSGFTANDLLLTADSFERSFLALHELIGLVYYRLRFR